MVVMLTQCVGCGHDGADPRPCRFERIPEQCQRVLVVVDQQNVDACGIEQEVPAVTIGASRGDAILGGLASGALPAADVGGWMSSDRVVRPRDAARAAHDRRYRASGELYRATKSIVHELGAT